MVFAELVFLLLLVELNREGSACSLQSRLVYLTFRILWSILKILDHIGPFVPFFYHFEKNLQFWTILDCLRLLVFFEQLWITLDNFGPFQTVDHLGLSWTIHDHFWLYWTIFCYLGIFWPVWIIFDHYTTIFDYFWPVRTILDHLTTVDLLILLDHFGQFWTILDNFGPFK